ncbi:hypothetical protein COU17_00975 [Candidatus Kaiserbacteria bacterium CG10_big_fil_rev_8_21_14_0_10_49_17]|uniref:CARDB domain-containing protein n=1 Tax=Candidatus Kaiserbacteria bacterium CG10_big_fil_rev_8_21_14_0_10_49_17 TaxID=1974609 RepID=A0A2M6WEX2_9BACT|nr:MAG: hypothetical protein COU17_00975 [Candidatus Kaiserbacteria bacterium CG10_big_fil_rev_8_21_14_0_10_49_17]
MNNEGKTVTDAFMKALAVVGFIVLLFIGLWGTIQVVRALPNVFSGLAATLTSVFISAERIDLKSPTTVYSGEPFELSWEHTGKRGEGVYTFTFDCRPGVSFESPAQNGAYIEVFCGVPFNFTGAVHTIKLIATSEFNRYIDVPVRISYARTDTESELVVGERSLTLVNNTVSGSPDTTGEGSNQNTNGSGTGTTNTGSTGRTPGTRTDNTYALNGGTNQSNPYGKPDLTAKVLEVGYVNSATKQFVASSSPHINERVAVKFEVINQGSKSTGAWSFNAVIPTYPSHIFHSQTQPSLAPGDKIEYVIGFDKTKSADTAEITINVDPTGSIYELNESNNIIRHTFNVTK